MEKNKDIKKQETCGKCERLAKILGHPHKGYCINNDCLVKLDDTQRNKNVHCFVSRPKGSEMVGQKDDARFIIIEKRVKLLEGQQIACMEGQIKVEEGYRNAMINLRDLINELIEE